jgi:nitrate/nitrite transporter NarK
MILGAIASSMINISLFPSIPLCCEQKLLGTAFGLLDGFQQLGGVIIPIFASMIIEATGGIGATNYIGFLYFFFAIAIINTAISLLLYMYDLRHDAILDKVYKEGDKKSMRRSTVFKQSLIM